MTKPVIGIVGGIGAGKSTVAAMLAELGCTVIDADRIGHQLLDEADVRAQIVELWGAGVLDAAGRVDRRSLAARVFGDPAQLAALNAVMHGRIRHRMSQAIQLVNEDASAGAAVLDAAVLLEAGWDDLCTHLVYVEAPASLREQRVRDSRGWESSAWAGREKMQISLDTKASKCQYIVRNSSSAACLREQVRHVLTKILESAGRSG